VSPDPDRPRQDLPYPDRDPRPWWFRDFEGRLESRFVGLDTRLGSIETKVGTLEMDRSQWGGVGRFWRVIGQAVVGLAALVAIVIGIASLAGGGGG
jgi:hypothetical protein